MGIEFKLKVYNYSDKTIDFVVKNCQCVYIPAKGRIQVPPRQWGEFDVLEISDKFWNLCFTGKSKFVITAFLGNLQLGNTTYRVEQRQKIRFYGTGVPVGSGFSGPSVERLAFTRTESYRDLFFNARGIYIDNSLKEYAQGGAAAIDASPPTMLVNSNEQFSSEIDDDALASIFSRVVEVATLGKSVYDAAQPADYGKKDAASDLKVAYNELKNLGAGYFNAYRTAVLEEDELTLHAFEWPGVPSFHLVFSDSLENSEDIMSGNFVMPPPPGEDNTFYSNVLHLK